ncbi:ATP-dependent RNA helicase SUV3, mitochondrial [Nakaseomyces bracarensis]|uniref:RNA helicase n=1 Tax=Nakaseomyces bracarensis TaxID=273131 RepID=A0ABR4NQN1_9SACH
MLRYSSSLIKYFGPLAHARSITSKALFNNNKWLFRKPELRFYKYKDGPDTDPCVLNVNPGKKNNLYIANADFRNTLSDALRAVYETKVNGGSKVDIKLKKYAWLRLKDLIHGQLIDNDLSTKLSTYKPSLSQIINPTDLSNIVLQMSSISSVNQNVWSKIIRESENITDIDKYIYFLSSYYDYILGKEIIPFMINSRDNQTTNSINFVNPSEWFPEARKIRRHIVMHVGPTNSGKTFKSLQKLKHAERGYYAGPLRLLAREVYDNFQSEGIRCNLLTGEEVIKDLDVSGNEASLTSGTVEMIPMNKKFDIVVLDEIQMMADIDRGWAWTNALLGVQAREIHCCGEQSAVPLIKRISEMTGDKFTINEYTRMGNLKVEDAPLENGFKSLRKGDCVVAFSKKSILDLKLEIEKKTKLKVAVIYGSLPPETRVKQATLFNTGEYDILVASDAIGMGLNLSIDRIIFTTSKKFNGREMVTMSDSNIKQIGGRAGRFKRDIHLDGNLPTGYITAVNHSVLKDVRKAIDSPIVPLESAVTWPTDEICAQYNNCFEAGTTCQYLLETIAKEIEKNSNKLFQICDLKSRLNAIKIIDEMDNISFMDKMRLSNAPLKDNPLVTNAFVQFCLTIAYGHTRGILSYKFPFDELDLKYIYNEKHGLERYEALYNIIMLFFWLSNRYPNYFIDQESAKDLKVFCEMIIFEKIDHMKKNPYKKKFGNYITSGRSRKRKTEKSERNDSNSQNKKPRHDKN